MAKITPAPQSANNERKDRAGQAAMQAEEAKLQKTYAALLDQLRLALPKVYPLVEALLAGKNTEPFFLENFALPLEKILEKLQDTVADLQEYQTAYSKRQKEETIQNTLVVKVQNLQKTMQEIHQNHCQNISSLEQELLDAQNRWQILQDLILQTSRNLRLRMHHQLSVLSSEKPPAETMRTQLESFGQELSEIEENFTLLQNLSAKDEIGLAYQLIQEATQQTLAQITPLYHLYGHYLAVINDYLGETFFAGSKKNSPAAIMTALKTSRYDFRDTLTEKTAAQVAVEKYIQNADSQNMQALGICGQALKQTRTEFAHLKTIWENFAKIVNLETTSMVANPTKEESSDGTISTTANVPEISPNHRDTADDTADAPTLPDTTEREPKQTVSENSHASTAVLPTQADNIPVPTTAPIQLALPAIAASVASREKTDITPSLSSPPPLNLTFPAVRITHISGRGDWQDFAVKEPPKPTDTPEAKDAPDYLGILLAIYYHTGRSTSGRVIHYGCQLGLIPNTKFSSAQQAFKEGLKQRFFVYRGKAKRIRYYELSKTGRNKAQQYLEQYPEWEQQIKNLPIEDPS